VNDQAPPLHPVVAKVKRIEAELNRYIIGMEREIHGAFLALAARQHVFLLSPPGAGKTLLASEVCRRVRGASYFKMQLDASVSKDDLFGPVSIRALRDADSLTRRTEGNLPTADIAQLDEIWKCPPMILHTLLTLLNEREYRNGEQLLAAPLVSCFVTSNETPPADRSLDALYDRILLRYQVKPLRNIEERQRASTFRVRMRAFEAEARRVAADIAHERERSFALRADEIERDALTAARAQAHIELRARQAELAVSAGGVLEAMMSQLTNDAERRSLELQAEALDAAAAEIARLRAEIDSGAIDRPGTPAYLAHPERWLIDS
jgi:MoxR-like ATPase